MRYALLVLFACIGCDGRKYVEREDLKFYVNDDMKHELREYESRLSRLEYRMEQAEKKVDAAN